MTFDTAVADPSERPANAGTTSRSTSGSSALSGDQVRTFVTFDIGDQTIAADVTDVREILDGQSVSPLPNATANLKSA